MTAKNLHVHSMPHNRNWWPHFSCSWCLIQAVRFDSSKTHNANETVVTAVQDRHSETFKCQGEMWDNMLTFVEWWMVTMTVTGMQEAGHTEIQPLLCCFLHHALWCNYVIWTNKMYNFQINTLNQFLNFWRLLHVSNLPENQPMRFEKCRRR